MPVTLTATPDTVPQGGVVTLTATIQDTIFQDLIFTWFQNGQEIGMTTDSTFEWTVSDVSEDVTYTVTATTPENCMGSSSDAVFVLLDEHQIPNVFSPDGDGTNEVFKVYSNGVNEVTSIKIFNRWGQVVFQGIGADAGWDGKYKDKDAPADVYIYVVEFADGTQEKGEVTLLRSR